MAEKTVVERILEQMNLLSNADFQSWMLNNVDQLIEEEREQIALPELRNKLGPVMNSIEILLYQFHIAGLQKLDVGPLLLEELTKSKEIIETLCKKNGGEK